MLDMPEYTAANPMTLGEKEYIGKLELIDPYLEIEFSFKSLSLQTSIMGTLDVSQTLGDMRFTLPHVMVSISTKHLMAVARQTKYTFWADSDRPVTVGPVAVVASKTWGGGWEGGCTFGFEARAFPNVISHFAEQIAGGNKLVPLLDKIAEQVGDRHMMFTLSGVSAPLTYELDGEEYEMKDDGFSLSVDGKIQDMLSAIGIPLEVGDITVTLALKVPFKAILGVPGYSPKVDFSAKNVANIGDSLQISLLGISIQGVKPPVVVSPGIKVTIYGQAKWKPDEDTGWLTLAVDGSIDTGGNVEFGLAMSGMWKKPFGISPLSVGNMWLRLIFATQNPAYMVCPGPCYVKGIGLGGEVPPSPLWSLVLGPWPLVLGPWSLALGPWSLVLGPW